MRVYDSAIQIYLSIYTLIKQRIWNLYIQGMQITYPNFVNALG